MTVGVSICEDLWFPCGPVADLGAEGAQLVVNLNASPYSIGRRFDRLAVLEERVAEAGCAIGYVNQVGGQDELVFDGGSVLRRPQGEDHRRGGAISRRGARRRHRVARRVRTTGPHTGAVEVVELSSSPRDPVFRGPPVPSRIPSTRRPRYTRRSASEPATTSSKNGFTDAVIAMSGGVDSSLVATIATDALGAANVHGIALPSRYSSAGSVTDAETSPPISASIFRLPRSKRPIEAFAELLSPVLGGAAGGLTDENLQSRIRGVVLMAMSNATTRLDRAHDWEQERARRRLLDSLRRLCRWVRRHSRRPEDSRLQALPLSQRLAGRDLIPRSRCWTNPLLQSYGRTNVTTIRCLHMTCSIRCSPALSSRMSRLRSCCRRRRSRVAERVARLVDLAEYKRRQSPPGFALPHGPSARIGVCRSPTGFHDGVLLEVAARTRPRRSHPDASPLENHAGAPIALTLLESALLLGCYTWVEFRLFEVLGGWVANETEPEARVLFDIQSRHHAWHSSSSQRGSPMSTASSTRALVTVASDEATVELLSTLGGVPGGEEGGGGTLVRLVGFAGSYCHGSYAATDTI